MAASHNRTCPSTRVHHPNPNARLSEKSHSQRKSQIVLCSHTHYCTHTQMHVHTRIQNTHAHMPLGAHTRAHSHTTVHTCAGTGWIRTRIRTCKHTSFLSGEVTPADRSCSGKEGTPGASAVSPPSQDRHSSLLEMLIAPAQLTWPPSVPGTGRLPHLHTPRSRHWKQPSTPTRMDTQAAMPQNTA